MLVPSASGMFTQDGCPHPAARSPSFGTCPFLVQAVAALCSRRDQRCASPAAHRLMSAQRQSVLSRALTLRLATSVVCAFIRDVQTLPPC